jgi:hypothetical protein
MDHNQRHQQSRRDTGGHAGLDPRQQGDQIGGDQQEYQLLDPETPGRRNEEMLGQQARHRMGLHQHRRHRRADRRDEHAADGRRGRSDQDDLVAILLIGNLAALDVEEGIDREGGTAVLVLVVEGQHPGIGIGADLELAELDRVSRCNLNVGHGQVMALCRHQQRKGGIGLVEVRQYQRLGANGAIDVRRHVEVADRSRHLAQGLDHAGIDPQRREGGRIGAAGQLDGILLDVIGQVLVRPATRFAQHEQHRQRDIAGLGQCIGQAAIGVQLLVGLDQQCFDLRAAGVGGGRNRRGSDRSRCGITRRRSSGSRGSRWNAHAAGLDQLADIRQALVTLRLGIEHRGGNYLGLGGRQLVHHVGHDFARPWPAAYVVQAGLVDCNYRDFLGRRTRGGGHTHVIGLALQPLQQVTVSQKQHNDADHHAEEPVTFPEVSLLHRSLPCVRALIKTGQ